MRRHWAPSYPSRDAKPTTSIEAAAEGLAAFLEKRPPAYPNKVSTDLPDIWPHWKPPEFS
jgi:hypothetical protein